MSKPEAVVCVGAGLLQISLIHTVQALGFHCIATDANPAAPGALVADEFCIADTYDALATAAFLPALQERYTLRGIVTAGADVAPTVSYCASEVGLLGIPYATACVTHDKALVRETLESAGLMCYQPRWMLAAGEWSNEMRMQAIANGVLGGWPVVVKPLEQRASRGVSIVCTPEAFPAAVAKALVYGEDYLIEECLIGTEHSAEMLLRDGEVLWFNVVDRFFDYTSGTGIETGHVNPSSLPASQMAAIREMVLAVAEALGVDFGAFKVDVMFTAAGAKVLECTARLSGGWDSQWTSPATGRHPMRQLVQLACGLPVEPQAPAQGTAACAAILPQKAGLVLGLPWTYPGVNLVWAIEPEESITPATHNGMRVGYVLAHAATATEAWSRASQAAQIITAIVEAETEGDEDAEVSN